MDLCRIWRGWRCSRPVRTKPMCRHVTSAKNIFCGNTASFVHSLLSLSFLRPMPSETDSLLPRQNGNPNPSFASRFSAFIKAEGQPTWAESYKWFFFGSWFNVLLVFVPLSVIAHKLNWDVALRFTFSFLAIMPLAKVRDQLWARRELC